MKEDFEKIEKSIKNMVKRIGEIKLKIEIEKREFRKEIRRKEGNC